MGSQRYVSPDLTHFVGRSLGTDECRYRLLRRILRGGVLKARPKPRGLRAPHVLVINTNEKLSSNEAYRGSVVCFCDIPLSDLPLHMRKYRRFGLAFRKGFLLEQGALPVLYIPLSGRPGLLPFGSYGPGRVSSQEVSFDQFWKHFNRLRETARELGDGPQRGQLAGDLQRLTEFLDNNILSHLKFFNPRLPDDHDNNFYMEREWRVSRDVQFSLNDIRRIIVPARFSRRFRRDFSKFAGELVFAGF
jgi:hypothetical protein